MEETGGSIIILCAKAKRANMIAGALRRQGLKTTVAVTAEDAMKKLRRTPHDMAICEQPLAHDDALEFLAEVRANFPLTQRVILAETPLDVAAEEIVNRIGASAVVSCDLDPDRIWRLLVLEGAVNQVRESASSEHQMEVQRAQFAMRQLRRENAALARELHRLQARLSLSENRSNTPAPEPADVAARARDPRAGKFAERLCDALDAMIKEPDARLPVIPSVGLQVQQMLARDDVDFSAVAELIEVEQAMSARILQVANSPMYAGLERTRNLQQALTRLGLRESRIVLQAIIAENLFHTRSRTLVRLMAQLWMHSLCVAYSNENIAQMLRMPNGEDYFTMGLLHDVGKLVVLHLLEQSIRSRRIAPEEIVPEDVLEVMNSPLHHDFGVRLMEHWNYSKMFRDVVAFHDDDAVHEQGEHVVVTFFSNLLARRLGHSLLAPEVDAERIESKDLAEALNIPPGSRLLLENELREQVRKIAQTYFGRP